MKEQGLLADEIRGRRLFNNTVEGRVRSSFHLRLCFSSPTKKDRETFRVNIGYKEKGEDHPRIQEKMSQSKIQRFRKPHPRFDEPV